MILNFYTIYSSTNPLIYNQSSLLGNLSTEMKISNYSFLGIYAGILIFSFLSLFINKIWIYHELKLFDEISFGINIILNIYSIITIIIFVLKPNLHNEYFDFILLYSSIILLVNLFLPFILQKNKTSNLSNKLFLICYVPNILLPITQFSNFNLNRIINYNQQALLISDQNIPVLTIQSNLNKTDPVTTTKVNQSGLDIDKYIDTSFKDQVNDLYDGLNNNKVITNVATNTIINSIQNFVNNNIYKKLGINANQKGTVYDQLLSSDNAIISGINNLLITDITADDPYSTAVSKSFFQNPVLYKTIINNIVSNINNKKEIYTDVENLIQNIITSKFTSIVNNHILDYVLNSCENGIINLAVWDTTSSLYQQIVNLIKNMTTPSNITDPNNILSTIIDILVAQFNHQEKKTTNLNALQNTLNSIFIDRIKNNINVSTTLQTIMENLVTSGSPNNNFMYSSMGDILKQIDGQSKILLSSSSTSPDMVTAINNYIKLAIDTSSNTIYDAVPNLLKKNYQFNNTENYINSLLTNLFSPYQVYPIAYTLSTGSIINNILNMMSKELFNNVIFTDGLLTQVMNKIDSSFVDKSKFYEFAINYYKSTITTDNVDFPTAIINAIINSYSYGNSSYNLKNLIRPNITPSNLVSSSNLSGLSKQYLQSINNENFKFTLQSNNSCCLKNKNISISNINSISQPKTITFTPNTVIQVKDFMIVFQNYSIVNVVANNVSLPFTSGSIGSSTTPSNSYIIGTYLNSSHIPQFLNTISLDSNNNYTSTAISISGYNWSVNNFTYTSNDSTTHNIDVIHCSGYLFLIIDGLYVIILTTQNMYYFSPNNGITKFQQLLTNIDQSVFVTAYTYQDSNKNTILIVT